MQSKKIYGVIAAIVFLTLGFVVVEARGEAFSRQDIAEQLEVLRGYDYKTGTEAFRKIEAIVRQCGSDEELRRSLEEQMVMFLKSDATAAGKWVVCKQLWIIGTEGSAAVLGEMLKDEATAEMACYALRSNRSAAVVEVLCAALEKVDDNGKVRIINMLGERREQGSVEVLGKLLSSNSGEVVESAAVALGKISGDAAIEALSPLHSNDDAKIRLVVAEADLRYAEWLARQGRKAEAVAVYRKLLEGEDKLFRRSGLLGIMSIGGEEGVECVKLTLGGDDEVLRSTAISNSAMLKGTKVTGALIAELPRLGDKEQSLLIYALADRGDRSVSGVITEMAQSGSSEVRQAALGVLGEIGDASSVQTLCDAIGDDDGETRATQGSLRRIEGKGVEGAIIEAMRGAEPELRVELIRVLSDRRAADAVEALVGETLNTDSDVCKAAFRALGKLAGEEKLAILIEQYMGVKDAGCLAEAERAVIAVAKKRANESQRADEVISAYEGKSKTAVRCSLLRVLGGIANDKALSIVRAAVGDEDETVQDTAVRELAAWPDIKAMNSLSSVMEESSSDTHRVFALRGYVRLLQLPSGRPTEETLAMYRKAFGYAERAEDKKLLLSGLGNVAAEGALRIVEGYLDDEEVALEAAIARDKIVEQMK